ncbi:MAG TPA: YicC family protein [Synergistales bacterium]|jgi:uncharacterized protein (TIGR00255 family)|nr:YicC family protein [Synergistales bacterium]HRV70626.1 YicC family protein [Thermovirgaceae bacterium]
MKMLRSMTGFSRTSIDRPFGSISLEISSVNHRNQEIFVKSPRELFRFEQTIQQEIRKASRRGKIQVRLEVCWGPAFRGAVIDRIVLDGYIRDTAKARAAFGLPEDVQVEQLLSLPGVMVSSQETEELEKEIEEAILSLVAAGIREWVDMKKTEGSHLEKEILAHLEGLESRVIEIENRWKAAKAGALSSMKERIISFVESGGFDCDEGRLAQEIVILNDKWDISEELARLASHMDKFRSMVDNKGVNGKTLDFLVQEMNREINTVASKVQDAEIRWLSVEAKSELESVREQIQNVE